MQSIWLKKAAMVGMVALGAMSINIAPASAHYTTTRCDSDGDDCYAVVCDDDGDDCRRVSSYSRDQYDRRGYRGGYWNGYGGSNGFGWLFGNGWSNGYNGYDNGGYRHHRHHHDDDDDE